VIESHVQETCWSDGMGSENFSTQAFNSELTLQGHWERAIGS